MSTSAQQVPALTTTVERRFYPRIVSHSPIFVAFDECKEGLLLNVSENGLLVSTPTELRCNFVARISIPLNGLPKPVQVNVRVVWASEARKLAGIQLLDLSEYDRERIRKWGTRESTQSLKAEPNQPLVVVVPSTTSSETTHATRSFTKEAPSSRPRDIAPLAPSLLVRTRSASAVAAIAMWAVLIATVCLAAAFFLRNGALGNPFARSTENLYESSAAAPPAQDIQGRLQNPDTSKRGAVSHAASLTPTVGAAKSKSALSRMSALQDSAQTGEDTSDDDDPGGPAAGTAQNQRHGSRIKSTSPSKPTMETNRTPDLSRLIAENRAEARNDQSLTGAIPAVADAAPKRSSTAANSSVPSDATPETLPAFPDPLTAKEPIRNPMRANDVATGTSATISSSPVVAPTRPASSRKSDASVIQMDAPRGQVMEIHLPRGYQASFFNLPGERVVESPSVTMHIQRSVRMPTTHLGWPFNRTKKVVVGELISRVDPQAVQIPIGSSDSVRVKATVAKDGSIESVRAILGAANLVPAVIKAVHEWRYQPTLIDNKPVETQCNVVVQFHAPAGRAARR
jgi:hypothetical protein